MPAVGGTRTSRPSSPLRHPERGLPATLRHVLLARLRAAGDGPSLVVAAAGLLARPAADTELVAAVDGDERAVRVAYDKHLLAPRPRVDRQAGHLAIRCSPRPPTPSCCPRSAGGCTIGWPWPWKRIGGGGTAADCRGGRATSAGRNGDDALTWSVRAADAAKVQFAYAEAGRWYATAVARGPRQVAAAAGPVLVGARGLRRPGTRDRGTARGGSGPARPGPGGSADVGRNRPPAASAFLVAVRHR